MPWTKNRPTVPVWYWMQQEHDDEPRIEKVREYGGKMCILNWEIPDSTNWSGPIEQPNAT